MAQIARDLIDKGTFIKSYEQACEEVDWMMEYLDVDKRKQIGNRSLMRSEKGKWDWHEIFLAICKKFQQIESDLENATKTERKRPGRPKKVG